MKTRIPMWKPYSTHQRTLIRQDLYFVLAWGFVFAVCCAVIAWLVVQL